MTKPLVLPTACSNKGDGGVLVRFYNSEQEVLLIRIFEVWESLGTGESDEFWEKENLKFLNTVGSHNAFTFAVWVLGREDLRELLLPEEEREFLQKLPVSKSFRNEEEYMAWCEEHEREDTYISKVIYESSNPDLVGSSGGYLSSIFLGSKYDRYGNKIPTLNMAATMYLTNMLKTHKVQLYSEVKKLVSYIRLCAPLINDDELCNIVTVACLMEHVRDEAKQKKRLEVANG